MTPLLVIHIAGGSVGFATGVAALTVRKGGRLHRGLGTVFFAAMLIMAAAAIVLAVQRAEPGNIVGGAFALYLTATAWMTVRRPPNQTGLFEWGAMAAGFAVAAGNLGLGLWVVESGVRVAKGPPIAMAFVFAGLTALAAIGDLSVILRGGLAGRQRIARHLWRVCFALFTATGSFYTQVVLAKLPMSLTMAAGPWLLAPIAAPLLVMVFWLARVGMGTRFTAASA